MGAKAKKKDESPPVPGFEARAGRFCYYIPPTQEPGPEGWRVAIVWEDEDGYHWTGDEERGVQPWFWGDTLKAAEKLCAEANKRLGLTEKEAAIIVMRSMTLGMRGPQRMKMKSRQKKRTVIEALEELDALRVRVDGYKEFYIVKTEGRGRGRAPADSVEKYLSGAPYLWSTFSERAFVFESCKSAEELIKAYPRELKQARVEERER